MTALSFLRRGWYAYAVQDQLCGQRPSACMQESEDQYAQDIQWHRPKGQMLHGWFFGFKLHLICNEKGELLNFMITPDDVDDRKPLEYKAFVEFIYGNLVGDKGYIGKRLFERLFVDGIFQMTDSLFILKYIRRIHVK